MSDAYSYPGVYIVEAPSSVHTIVGVPTAITAFVGAAARGPINEPITVQSTADYARRFGGDGSRPLDRAVRLFFQNGGGDAIIVRVAPTGVVAAKATIGGVAVAAASAGAWGAGLSYTIDQTGVTPTQQDKLYNLTVEYRLDPHDTEARTTEIYPRVSIDSSSPRALPRLLASSTLVVVDTTAATRPSPPGATKGKAGTQPAAADSPPTTDAAGAALPATATAKDMVVGPTDFQLDPTKARKPSDPLPVDAPPAESDLAGSDDQTGFQAVAKHNTFFNLLVITPVFDDQGNAKDNVDQATLGAAAAFAKAHRAMLLVDSPVEWSTVDAAVLGRDDFFAQLGSARDNAALYFPRVELTDSNGVTIPNVGASGAVAGLYANTDLTRGVWKAPAGIAVQLGGIADLALRMSDFDNGRLNPVAVNCLRSLPVVGDVIWGARTMNGDDLSASQWKYIPVRRLALFIEESLFRGTKWVVFEPNDEPLWAQVRLNVGAFMHTLFRQGAFQGQTAKEAYFVACDSSTNPQADIDRGILNVVVGFAPLKPAEFVVVTIQQITGDIQV